MAVAAGTLGVVGITCKGINKKLKSKSQKHALINQTAKSKLNSILYIINEAINDNNISDDEFKLVVNEMNKYNELKEKYSDQKIYQSGWQYTYFKRRKKSHNRASN